LNIFSLLTAAYFMLSLVRIGTTLRLAWPRFVFEMQLLAQFFTLDCLTPHTRTCAFVFHGAGLIAVFSFLSWDQFGKR
jgi:hypothetical protein